MTPTFERRPWGWFEVLMNAPDYKIKRLFVEPGNRLSLQYHERRQEHWFVVSGEGLATIGPREIPLVPGESVDVAVSVAHRIHNTGYAPMMIIEVQTGESFDEDDIVRLDDDFGRVTVAPDKTTL